MDHESGGQPITFGDFGVPGLAVVQETTFLEKFRPGRAVNRAIDPAATQQRLVRGINDGVNCQCSDIGTNGTELSRHFASFLNSRRVGAAPERLTIGSRQ
jgi:hypothetical protein